ncbi:MAG TPA: hypothetical protein VEC17_03100 [Candidatus Binatia bacterium]|nr:hypothetical protein [Candidatus Binatia bacterium]
MKKIIIIIGLVFFASVAHAHTTGISYDVAQDGYIVDIGTNKEELLPNELVLFDYKLFNQTDTSKLADFDNVYVTISDDTGVIMSTFLYSPKDLLTVLSYSFERTGTYTMSARFNRGQLRLTEVTFPLEVRGGMAQENIMKIGALVLIGTGLGWYGMNQYKKNKLTQG